MSMLESEFERLEMALALAYPATTSVPNRELPPEIWKMILSYLDLDGADLVIYCRLVNRCWRDLVNQILRESTSLWKPTFGTTTEMVKGRCGIRFKTPEEITRFIFDMKRTTNPFPNGTAIFIPSDDLTKEEEIAFHDNFCKLLDAFNDAILKLVYIIPLAKTEAPLPRTRDIDLTHQLQSIMNLRKLKSLVIDIGRDWNEVKTLKCLHNQILLKYMLKSSEATLPENLKELHIYGTHGIIPLFHMFRGFESALKSVSSLEISNSIFHDPALPMDEGVDFSMCQFPNLRRLKVCFPNTQFLQQFHQFRPNCVASLKEVSLYFEHLTASHLKDAFALIDLHAETLELLHLEIGSGPGRIVPAQLTGLYSSINYTKLKTFTFNCVKIEFWQAFIRALLPKLVNLQEVTLFIPTSLYRFVPVPTEDPEGFRLDFERIPEREQYEKVAALWDTLSDTVAVIHVPDYGWELKRREPLNLMKMK